jgi:hypothetical protein
MKSKVIWDVTLRKFWGNRRFGKTYRLHTQIKRIFNRSAT